MRRFLALLTSFVISSLLHPFSCHFLHQLFVHPPSLHLVIYFLVYFLVLIPNSYTTIIFGILFYSILCKYFGFFIYSSNRVGTNLIVLFSGNFPHTPCHTSDIYRTAGRSSLFPVQCYHTSHCNCSQLAIIFKISPHGFWPKTRNSWQSESQEIPGYNHSTIDVIWFQNKTSCKNIFSHQHSYCIIADTYTLTYLITPWGKVLLEKLTGS
jgi:hypothetical protein